VRPSLSLLIFVAPIFFFGCSKSGNIDKPDRWEVPYVITTPDVDSELESSNVQVKDSTQPEEIKGEEVGFDKHEDVEIILEDRTSESPVKDIVEETCLPSCSGKECGPDGCGGSCGTCPSGQPCINGKCQCIPNCTDKECGPDGCGGECKPGCAPGYPCLDNGKCAKDGPCSRIGSIACEDPPIDSSTATQNSDVLDLYSCDENIAEGPEKVYKFVADQDGTVTFTLTPGLPISAKEFLRLYVLEEKDGLCSSRNCIDKDPNTVTISVTQGKSYYVVVDAIRNNTAGYTLEIVCSWYVPP